MQDFTLTTYKKLLQDLLTNRYSFQTLQDFIQRPEKKTVILRHDVDRLPGNSLKTALLENELGIRATYFFRTIPQTFKPEIIKEIAELGHEIGYHYEDMDLSSRGQRSEVTPVEHPEREPGSTGQGSREKSEGGGRRSEVRRARARVGGHKELGDSAVFDKAIKSFERNLSILREVVPVKTICMHGSPLSKWDNRDLWMFVYNYR